MGQKRLPAGQNSSYGHLNHVSVYVKREWNDNCPDAATPSISALRMPTHAGRLERKGTSTVRPMTSRRAVSPSPQKSGPKPPRVMLQRTLHWGALTYIPLPGAPLPILSVYRPGQTDHLPLADGTDRTARVGPSQFPDYSDRATDRVAGERKTPATLSIIYTMSAWFSSREKNLLPRFIRKNPLIRDVRSF